MKNIIVIGILILFIYYFICINREDFTQAEMNDYSNLLKINCDENTKSFKYLNKLNKEKCDIVGKTDRETINNKLICHDTVNKEITALLDMESNCVMNDNTKQYNQTPSNQIPNSIRGQVPTTIIYNTESEGPEFINKWDIATYDSKRPNDYSVF